MAEAPLKRHREETQVEEEEESKRHKPYSHILSLLETDQEDESNQDLSSLFTTLQQELYSDFSSDPLPEPPSEADPTTTLDSGSSSPVLFRDDEDEEDKEKVIRHLLEASDDELGIPHVEIRVGKEEDEESNGRGGGMSWRDDGLWWEFEDEAANYYTLLQSELFM
ncbi:hypothetical protein HHK36_024769 [Tetracentron sinense]|uniref:Uncharacterized protein n=1 Tax=Tetracentron sinense TaxID=13715 RepID=A0A835D7T2_TETSI|nr:hypothetical protein HHK36_024769 [Tetracentron sinense]